MKVTGELRVYTSEHRKRNADMIKGCRARPYKPPIYIKSRDQRPFPIPSFLYLWSNVASEASYWCNRRETSEIQARPTRGSEALYAHAQYNTRVLGNAWCTEFRRGFCTLVSSAATYMSTQNWAQLMPLHGPGLECEKRCWYAIIDHWPGVHVMEER